MPRPIGISLNSGVKAGGSPLSRGKLAKDALAVFGVVGTVVAVLAAIVALVVHHRPEPPAVPLRLLPAATCADIGAGHAVKAWRDAGWTIQGGSVTPGIGATVLCSSGTEEVGVPVG